LLRTHRLPNEPPLSRASLLLCSLSISSLQCFSLPLSPALLDMAAAALSRSRHAAACESWQRSCRPCQARSRFRVTALGYRPCQARCEAVPLCPGVRPLPPYPVPQPPPSCCLQAPLGHYLRRTSRVNEPPFSQEASRCLRCAKSVCCKRIFQVFQMF
jgi:hypothetical protein